MSNVWGALIVLAHFVRSVPPISYRRYSMFIAGGKAIPGLASNSTKRLPFSNFPIHPLGASDTDDFFIFDLFGDLDGAVT
jgi:hypothetical protein